jgi:hypothetical protein
MLDKCSGILENSLNWLKDQCCPWDDNVFVAGN